MTTFDIAGRAVGDGAPTYVIAELSANHSQELGRALELVDMAADAGADAVKIQTYTAGTLTIDSDAPPFVLGPGSPWAGRTLHELYREAYTPWEWTERLMERAVDAGVTLFSSPFDPTAVEFLADLDVPAYKIASFELVDTPLIELVASKGKPVIMSTGMATLDEIELGVAAAAAAPGVGILRCTSSYPAPLDGLDLYTITDLRARFDAVVGLSDHTLTTTVPIAAVALGARIVEKHLTVRRADGGPDAGFSLEPEEFAALVNSIRDTEAALGSVRYGPTDSESQSVGLRRSLFVVKDVSAGDLVDKHNVRSIRPGDGLAPSQLAELLGRAFKSDVARGTPLSRDLVTD